MCDLDRLCVELSDAITLYRSRELSDRQMIDELRRPLRRLLELARNGEPVTATSMVVFCGLALEALDRLSARESLCEGRRAAELAGFVGAP